MQQKKTQLFKNLFAQNNQKCKTYSRNIFIEQLLSLLSFFYYFQRTFIALIFFIYFDINCCLFVKLDAIKKQKYKIKIYYVKNNFINNNFRKSNI